MVRQPRHEESAVASGAAALDQTRASGSAAVFLASVAAAMPLPVVLVARSARAVVLLAVLVFIRLTEGMLRRRYPAVGPRLLRRQLESAGAGFAKIGQLLAHRHDVLPDRYCGELASILDDLPWVPTPLITRRIERELRITSLGDIFSEFDDRPLSAASIAQVHRARLLDGTTVVVKVMRPGVETKFRVDLAIAGMLARFASLFLPFRRMGIRGLANELRHLTQEELDFTREVRNFRQLRHRMLSDEIDHCCPVVFPEHSAPTVITMEEVRGVSVKELMQTAMAARAVTDGDDDVATRTCAIERLAQWANDGITPERTARLMVRSFLEQAMRHRLFHADPHAANMIVMKGGTLAWIDLGMIGWLDERLWAQEFKLREAIAEGRLDAAYNHLLATMEPLPAGDLSAFEAEFKRILRDWLAEIENPGQASPGQGGGFSRRSNFHLFTQTLSAIRRAGLRLPAPLVRLYRTIIIGDMVVLQLDPSVNWQELIQDFVADERLRQTVELCERGPSVSNARAAMELLVEGPRLLVEAMTRIRQPTRSEGSRTRAITRGERATRRILGQVKLAVTGTSLVLFLASLLPSRWIPEQLAPGIAATRPYLWWVLGGAVVAIWLLSQVQEEFED